MPKKSSFPLFQADRSTHRRDFEARREPSARIAVDHSSVVPPGLFRPVSDRTRLLGARYRLQEFHRRHLDLFRVRKNGTDGGPAFLDAHLLYQVASTEGTEESLEHSRLVTRYSLFLAKRLGIRDKRWLIDIQRGAALHDIGKIGLPESLLCKRSRLTVSEMEIIKEHPLLGYEVLADFTFLKDAARIILFHHERFDGRGYPYGLSGEAIPLEARIFAFADALDAITSHRPYRKERDFKNAKKEIQANAGTQFDPEVVEAFSSIPLENWERIRFETTRFLPDFEKINPSILRR